MTRTLFLVFLIFFISSAAAQKYNPETEAKFNSLRWLEGNWKRTDVEKGIKANEKWFLNEPYHLQGYGATIKGQDTLFEEKINIIIKGTDIYYVADVKENKEPVYFKFTTLTPNGFICENPEHDFPKKIEYRLTDSNLTVIISAGDKSQSYLFTKQ